MKAAVCYEYGKPLVVEEINIDPPQRGEVKVRLAVTAICHSDIGQVREGTGGHLPFVSGHECAGYVDEVGEGVTSVKPGDATVVCHMASCGKCFYCLTGRPHLCEYDWPLNRESRISNKQGQRLGPVIGFAGFAEYVIVDQSQLVKIPKEMPMDRAALLACGVITGFGAVVNRAKVQPHESVVVIGAGGIGLNAVQGAAFVSAHPVIAVDINDKKLQAARTFGAKHTINSKQEDAIKVVKQLTSGHGADYVFVTVSSASGGSESSDPLVQGFSMSGPRGTTVIVGLSSMKKGMVSLPVSQFLKDERVLMGCYMGSTNLGVDIPRLVALYQAGRLKLDELITGRYPLEKINEAIDSVERGEALRNVIVF